MSTIDVSYAELVLLRRRRLGLSQPELAMLAGVSAGTVKNIEKGRSPIAAVRRDVDATLDRLEGELVGGPENGPHAGGTPMRAYEGLAA